FQQWVSEKRQGAGEPPFPACPPRDMPFVEELLALLEDVAPSDLSRTATLLGRLQDWDPADPAVRFIGRVLAQAYAEQIAIVRCTLAGEAASESAATSTCPVCAELPVAAVLRPEGEGGKRSLVCSLCFTEWPFRRLLCPNCGEEDQAKLPVFRADPFPHV